MDDRPPPTRPPAGWYPDPSGAPGYRWWDGSTWTDTYAPDPSDPRERGPGAEGLDPAMAGPWSEGAEAGAASDLSDAPDPSAPASWVAPDQGSSVGVLPPAMGRRSTFGPLGEWLSESFRLSLGRLGHVLPLILILVLTVNVATFVLLFFGLRGTVIELADDGTAEFDYAGSPGALSAAIGLTLFSLITAALFKSSVAYQVAAVRHGRAEEWSGSFRRSLRRAWRIVPATMARSVIYWVLALVFLVVTGIVPILGVVLIPAMVAALVLAWSRLSMVGIGAALGARGDGPFGSSLRLTGTDYWPLLGRLLLLALIAFNLLIAVNFLSSPLLLLVVDDPGTSSGSGGTQRFVMTDQLGPTASVAALRAFLTGLGLAANHLLAAVGTVLLYLRLGGTVDPSALPAEADGDGVGATDLAGGRTLDHPDS